MPQQEKFNSKLMYFHLFHVDPRITTTSDCVVMGAWVTMGTQKMIAEWKPEQKAKEDHATATESGKFSVLFLQVDEAKLE